MRRCAKVVDAAMAETSRFERRRPLAVSELLRVDVATTGSRKEDRRINPNGHRVERRKDSRSERDEPLSFGLASLLERPLCVPPANVYPLPASVDVLTAEAKELLGPKPGANGHDRKCPIASVELASF